MRGILRLMREILAIPKSEILDIPMCGILAIPMRGIPMREIQVI